MRRTDIEARIERLKQRRVQLADQIGAGLLDGVPDQILEGLRTERVAADREMAELLDAWAVHQDRLESLLPAGLVGRIY